MEYPNKIYVCEYKGDNSMGGKSHLVVVVAASDSEIAKAYVEGRIGIRTSPTWLMGAVYPTIYSSDGSKPAFIQAKILYNGNFHTYKKKET